MKKFIIILMLYGPSLPAWAVEVELEKIHIDTSVLAVERGVDTFMNACHGCHSLKYVHFRDLASFGIDKDKIAVWRGDSTLDAAMSSLMPDDAALQSFGKIPPDLSMMTKAREGGNNYLYSYLIGYYLTPEGMTGNHVFPETKMPDALGISDAKDPAQHSEVQAKAHDIVSFLSWAADPHEGERLAMGYYVIGYLVILTLLLYNVKLEIWSKIK
jgi:cytochrome c1